MPKLVKPFSDTAVKNIKAGDKAKKYSDRGQLYLHVYLDALKADVITIK